MSDQCQQELVAADHSKIYYRLFRKDFYIEVPEIANMSQEGYDDDILSLVYLLNKNNISNNNNIYIITSWD